MSHPTLIDLAYLCASLRKAQRQYFAARKRRPHDPCEKELRAARSWESQVDAAVAAILASQQKTLPGLEEGGDGPG